MTKTATNQPSAPLRMLIVGAIGLSLGVGDAQADDDRNWHPPDTAAHPHLGRHHDADHDRARQALDRGEVLPMAEILRRVAEKVPGDLVGVEFEQEDHQGQQEWIYELKILTAEGHLLELQVDAATGRLLSGEDD